MKKTVPSHPDQEAREITANRSEHYQIDASSVRQACENALETWQPAMGQFFLARFLDLQLHYTDHQCIIDFDVKPFMLNPKGTLHGGISALVMDTAMGHLILHLHGPTSTLEMKVQYLRPITPGPAKVIASVLKSGRKICFMQSEFYDCNEKLAASATSTWALL